MLDSKQVNAMTLRIISALFPVAKGSVCGSKNRSAVDPTLQHSACCSLGYGKLFHCRHVLCISSALFPVAKVSVCGSKNRSAVDPTLQHSACCSLGYGKLFHCRHVICIGLGLAGSE